MISANMSLYLYFTTSNIVYHYVVYMVEDSRLRNNFFLYNRIINNDAYVNLNNMFLIQQHLLSTCCFRSNESLPYTCDIPYPFCFTFVCPKVSCRMCYFVYRSLSIHFCSVLSFDAMNETN